MWWCHYYIQILGGKGSPQPPPTRWNPGMACFWLKLACLLLHFDLNSYGLVHWWATPSALECYNLIGLFLISATGTNPDMAAEEVRHVCTNHYVYWPGRYHVTANDINALIFKWFVHAEMAVVPESQTYASVQELGYIWCNSKPEATPFSPSEKELGMYLSNICPGGMQLKWTANYHRDTWVIKNVSLVDVFLLEACDISCSHNQCVGGRT